MKSASKQELADAVRATADGRAVFTSGLAGLVLGEYRRMAHRLRARLDPAADPDRTGNRGAPFRREGFDGQADRREVVPRHRTVENHVQATLRKLQVANRVELARYAIEHGLDESSVLYPDRTVAETMTA